jgi:hypothetical protein
MLQNKDIKKLSELKLTFLCKTKKSEFLFEFVDILKLGKLHSIFSGVKTKGISTLLLIRIMISLPFIDKSSVYSFSRSSYNDYKIGKDAFYRLKNNFKVNWRRFLFSTAIFAINLLNKRKNYNENNPITAFVFDDTTIQKTGKRIEGVSRVWNHVIQKSIIGYQLLVMGFYNGTSLLPVNFSLHREKGKNQKKLFGLKKIEYNAQYNKRRDNKSHGANRKKELDIKKTDSVIEMIKYAVKNGLIAQYVLTDSWFTSWKLVKIAIDSNMKFIGMFSKVKTLFTYNGKEYTYKEIRNLNKKNIKRNKKYNLYYIYTVVQWKGERVVLYHTRKGKRGNWKTILSTDLSLNFSQTIEVYQIRWSIEVFFKESKQMLNLGKSHSNDFDGQIADTTISLIQYIFLSVRNSVERYETKGDVYRDTKADIVEANIHQRLIALLIAIFEALDMLVEHIDIDGLFTEIINNDESFDKLRRMVA